MYTYPTIKFWIIPANSNLLNICRHNINIRSIWYLTTYYCDLLRFIWKTNTIPSLNIKGICRPWSQIVDQVLIFGYVQFSIYVCDVIIYEPVVLNCWSSIVYRWHPAQTNLIYTSKSAMNPVRTRWYLCGMIRDLIGVITQTFAVSRLDLKSVMLTRNKILNYQFGL